MTNSEEFLQAYNMIDKYLGHSKELESTSSFTYKVKNSKNKTIRKFKDELISFGELRNAIVHNPKIDGQAIAEPHSHIVQRIKSIYHRITSPMRVFPTFQFEVIGAHENEHINQILLKMKESSFSQFPVFDDTGKVIELINNNTISRWLSTNLEENGTLIIEDVRVIDLLSEIEFKQNYKFISKDATIDEAYELFLNQITSKRRYLDALFISQNGKPDGKLLGLITIEDIASLNPSEY